MKIGIDCRMIKATGIGRYISSLVENLSEIDQDNQYILFFKKKEFQLFKEPGPNFKKVLADFHWYGFSEQAKFPALLRSHNLDLVHFPHFNVPYLYKGKFIVNINDLTLHRHKTIKSTTKSIFTYQIKHLVYKLLIRRAVKKSLRILTISKFSKDDIIKTLKVPPEKIILTYLGYPSDRFLSEKPDSKTLEGFNLKKPFILYVGNAYPHKNLENLVRALKYLPSNITLVFVGKKDDFYTRIEKLVRDLGFKDRVIFTGYVSDERLAGLYNEALAFTFPSLNEGFGLPALEAMSFGLPVVSSQVSCLPEILGDAALYFNPQNPKDISSKIKEILEDVDLRKDLVKKGYNQIKKYSWEKMAKKTADVYKEVLNK